MIVAGKIRVQAPLHRVWAMLLEPETLQACIPGAEHIERFDERQYTIIIKQKVGPFPARFQMQTMLTAIEAPTHLELEGDGEGMGQAVRIVFKTRIDLRETAKDAVEISYVIDVQSVGTLALFGDRIMQVKAQRVEAEFAAALQERLNRT